MHCTYLSIFSKENSVGVLKDKTNYRNSAVYEFED